MYLHYMAAPEMMCCQQMIKEGLYSKLMPLLDAAHVNTVIHLPIHVWIRADGRG